MVMASISLLQRQRSTHSKQSPASCLSCFESLAPCSCDSLASDLPVASPPDGLRWPLLPFKNRQLPVAMAWCPTSPADEKSFATSGLPCRSFDPARCPLSTCSRASFSGSGDGVSIEYGCTETNAGSLMWSAYQARQRRRQGASGCSPWGVGPTSSSTNGRNKSECKSDKAVIENTATPNVTWNCKEPNSMKKPVPVIMPADPKIPQPVASSA
mmetsp:Transcript_111974/g.327453  ORF Transcript_111974/g.327453 Transcript_111974/m.327453 type:complete len:213 (-) Transcript_111974:110-748(-)